ncbi:hypothetical protein AB4Y32_00845 [Paraburkholderia phymatum]|uniref:Uncharacterized protein n=1 Tax=Paraburkholderia phymatum TaxID=148447 RepID=A0ACC6TSR2_9BURK
MSSNLNKALHAEHQRQIEEQLTDVHGRAQFMPSSRSGYLTTEAMADTVGVQAQSVRKRYSQTGTYFGLKPVKLPNRRLMWEANAVAKFLRGEEA